jgi:membrane-associated phospholipid phosphatase
MKQICFTLLISLLCFAAMAQQPVFTGDTTTQDTIKISASQDNNKESIKRITPAKLYHFRPAVDIPLVAVTAGWSGFAFSKIYSKPKSTAEEIRNLNKSNVPKIDRWAAGMHDENADANSNYFFYGSIPAPFFLFLDQKIRKDAAKITYLYLEAMSITGLFYTGSVFLVDRYRPETYDTTISVEDRQGGNYKDAFLGGHPALVATSLFFTAKVFADYYPDSKYKYLLYGVAIAGTGATAYLRHIAGKHFPTDLATGITLGTLCGILVPQLHKYKNVKERNMTLLPYFDTHSKGVLFAYSFH